jgi:hypothetical protein
MKQFLWCRKLLENNEYYYVYVTKEFAYTLCIKQGYEINIDPSEVPEDIRKEYGKPY